MNELTELQIKLADRLQKEGLCKNSKEWIYTDERDNSQTFSNGYYLETFSGAVFITNKRFGPLPTFELAIQEATKLLKKGKGGDDYEYIYIDESGLSIQQINNYEVGEPLFESSKVNTLAAIEALLYLSEEK